MSYVFDCTAAAISTIETSLAESEGLDRRGECITLLHHIGQVIAALHDLDHTYGGVLNRYRRAYQHAKMLDDLLKQLEEGEVR